MRGTRRPSGQDAEQDGASMNAIGDVIAELHHGEAVLADELLAVSDRHHSEHEICHVARDLERWSREHVQRLG